MLEFATQRRHMALAVSAGLALGLSTASAPAQEAPSYALSWTHGAGITGCASLSEVASAVEARLGHRVFASATEARRFIDARVESAPVGYRVVINVYEANGEKSGERSVSTAEVSCRALDQPLSLMLALIIDPTAAAAAPTPSVRAFPPVETSPAPQPPQPATSAGSSAPAEASAPVRPVLPASRAIGNANSAGAAVELKLGFGVLPGVTPGLATSLLIPASQQWAALVGATLWAPRRANDDASGLGAGFEMSQATLELCRTSAGARLQVMACAGAEPGVLVAQSYGLRSNSSHVKPTLDFELGARLAIRLGAQVSILAGGDLLVPAVRSNFRAHSAAGETVDVFQRPRLGGSASLGLALNIFP